MLIPLCAQDQDAIDFTDNLIPTLHNFPLMPRLQALYLGRNRISSIASGLSKSIANLHTLVLAQNQLAELADLEPLSELPKLLHLSLLENPVTSKEVRCRSASNHGMNLLISDAELPILGHRKMSNRALP